MGYGGVDGLHTVFPSAGASGSGKATSAGRPRRAKPPCKYGPRGPDGYCPKKPARARGRAGAAGRKKPCKYGPRGPDGYCPKKPRKPPATVAERAEKELKTRTKRVVLAPVRTAAARRSLQKKLQKPENVGKLIGAVQVLTGPLALAAVTAAAGLIFVSKWNRTRAPLEVELKNQLMRRYAEAINAAEEQLGRPLNVGEQGILRAKYDAGLKTIRSIMATYRMSGRGG